LFAGVSVELWKWHWRLRHLSFDLLSRLSGLGLVRGLPKLKYQRDLICAPCKHGKMVVASHPPLTSVMTETPCELFHMDLVDPTRVCSAGGNGMRDMEMLFELFVATMAMNLKILTSKPFVVIWVSNISFLLPMWLVRLVWLRGRIVPFVRWLGRCLMSIGLRGDIGRMR
jgi:hypothetical protein